MSGNVQARSSNSNTTGSDGNGDTQSSSKSETESSEPNEIQNTRVSFNHASFAPIQRNLLPLTAEVASNGHLNIGGLDLLDLAEEFGTPLFVYDEAHLRHACREALAAWGPGVAYATKAFLCRAMAELAYQEGMNLDVSTLGELEVALAAQVPADRLVLHGNNKTNEELQRALEVGVGRIVVDSFDEIARLGALIESRSINDLLSLPEKNTLPSTPTTPINSERNFERNFERPKVLIRVTPGVEVHTHEFVRTGQEDSKFGFSILSGAADAAVAAVELMGGVELVGIHAHIGSQVFDVGAFEQAAKVVSDFFAPLGLSELVVGGGLGVPYINGEVAPSQAEWAASTRQACERSGVSSSTRLSSEPGRSIVASAALTLYRVGTIKQLPNIRTYVSVDGGMSDNPRPVLYGSGYEAFLPRCTDSERTLSARVVGKHCESGDVIVRDAFLPKDLAVGDILATPVTGAYGYSMASNYNKVPRPAVIFVSDGKARTVVRRETIEDLLRLDL